VAITLAATPAHAASPANSAPRRAAQSSQIERHRHHDGWDRDRSDDGWGRDGYDDGWDGCHRHGFVGALVHWLI
jgi:hypothetical protein